MFGAQGRGPLPAFIINRTGISNNEYICAVREYQANHLCAAEGREFPTTERITILDQNAIERTPSSRSPVPQRLVRCTPEGWERAVRD